MVVPLEVLATEVEPEGAPDGFQDGRTESFVDGHADLRLSDFAEVDPLAASGLHDDTLKCAHIDGDGVEEKLGLDFVAAGLKPHDQALGLAMDTLCNRTEPVWPMKNAIK